MTNRGRFSGAVHVHPVTINHDRCRALSTRVSCTPWTTGREKASRTHGTDLALLVHTHADGHLETHEQDHADTADPCDDGEDEQGVGCYGSSVAAVERACTPVHRSVVGEGIWWIGNHGARGVGAMERGFNKEKTGCKRNSSGFVGISAGAHSSTYDRLFGGGGRYRWNYQRVK